MDAKSRQPKGRDNTVSVLNVAIEALNLAKEASSITPAKAVFGTVSIVLTTIKVSFILFLVTGCRWQTEMHAGSHGQSDRLRRTWVGLR